MKPPRGKKEPKEPKPVLQFTILYRVDSEHCNMDEQLEKLREYGAAEVIKAEVVDGPI